MIQIVSSVLRNKTSSQQNMFLHCSHSFLRLYFVHLAITSVYCDLGISLASYRRIDQEKRSLWKHQDDLIL